MSLKRPWTAVFAALLAACGSDDAESERLAAAEPAQQPATHEDTQESPTRPSSPSDRQHDDTPTPNTGAGSWAVYHRSIESLIDRAQVAVRGKVQSVVVTAGPPASALVQLVDSGTWWMKSSAESNPSSVPSAYTQGAASGTERDPLPEPGDDIIVFFEFADDGTPRVSGGPSGRFVVREGVVVPVVNDGIVLPADVDAPGFMVLIQGDADNEWRQPALGASMTVEKGQTVDVVLKTIGPGTYDAPLISSQAVGFVGPVRPRQYTPGGATQVFRLMAKESGDATITFNHSNAADGRVPLVIVLSVRS